MHYSDPSGDEEIIKIKYNFKGDSVPTYSILQVVGRVHNYVAYG